LTNLRTSAWLAFAFLFGTSVWSTASQALWQQTPSVLFQSIGVWFLLRGKRKGAASVAPGALFFSAATAARQNDALAAIVFTIFVLIQYRAVLFKWIAWAIPPAVLVVWYNAVYNGSPLVFGYQDGVGQYLSFPKIEALLGLLISPSRGLFVYSPFLILGIVGVWYARLERERLFYWSAALISVLMYVTLSMWNDWMGGWGYGTRMLTDLLPYISLLMIPVVTRLDRWGNLVFAVSVAYSGFVHSLGLWDYGGAWQWSWPEQRFDVWSISQNEIFFYIRHYFDLGLSFVSRFKR
jgi:hypothetical protein